MNNSSEGFSNLHAIYRPNCSLLQDENGIYACMIVISNYGTLCKSPDTH